MSTTRVYILARELGVKSSEIVKKCQAVELAAVRNHMAIISPEVAAAIRLWFTKAENDTTSERPPDNALGKCRNCLYFLPNNVDKPGGLCRRHPPRVVSARDTAEFLSPWPQVRDYDACGEFEYAVP